MFEYFNTNKYISSSALLLAGLVLIVKDCFVSFDEIKNMKDIFYQETLRLLI